MVGWAKQSGSRTPALPQLVFILGVLLLAGTEPQDALGITATTGIWLSTGEIQALPMTGPAWTALKAQADLSAGIPDLSNQDQMNNVNVLAKALVYVRTGIESYRTEVRQNCMAAINTELDGRTLALGRELAAYVISADMVGLEPSEDVTFRAWLRRTLTEVLTDGRTLQSTHEDRPNNWGTAAGASRAAVAIYLGDMAELARTAQVFKGWLGDRSSYAGFSYGDLSWQYDPANPVGINPLGATKSGESIDGALPEEMRRGCTFRFPPCPTGYPWGAIQGATVQAEILRRAGYDTWNWQNQALKRSVQFLYNLSIRYPSDGWWASGDDEGTPWLVNRAYGASFPTVVPAHRGKIMAWADWTHGSVSVPQATITFFTPTSGPAGTEVSVHGSRFSTVTAVTFNGAPAAGFTIDSDTLLRATAPAGAGSGPIRVTSPTGTATSAGTFTAIPPPAITFFTPTSGPVGIEVIVHGASLATVTAVTFSGAPAAGFTISSDTLLRATVPAAATSGPIGVTNPAGTATSAGSYTVIAPPAVTFFAPLSGPAGTEVTVHGASFSTITAVAFNGAPAVGFTISSDTLLRATVPAAATSGPIAVTNPAGTATSAGSYTVIPPPTITFFTPASGPAGTEVSVHGSRFSDVTAVTFNNTPAAGFTIDSDTLLRATAPAGAGSGPVRVTSPTGTVTSAGTFTVIPPPAITFFTPTSGPVGIEVSVHGTSLSTVTAVAFNGVPAVGFTISSDTLVRATVPGTATSGPIGVGNPAGTATSVGSFTVIPAPTISFFTPLTGPLGTEVTIHGASFSTVTVVTFNGTPAAGFTIDSDDLLRATAPAGAGSGPIGVTNPAGTATSGDIFNVIPPPTITFFTPTSGPVGTEVSVHGSRFSDVTAVTFNGAPAAGFTIDSDTLLRATAPAGAGSGAIRATSPAGTATSAGTFTVIPPPAITFFTPTSGPVGIEVTIHGASFSTVTALKFNGTPAVAFTISSDTLLRATVPAGATSGAISVTNPAGTATSAGSFTVIPPPTITFFTPLSGPVGIEVTVHGASFSTVNAVRFNGTPAASFTISSDTLLRATVPAGAGSGPIGVTNPAGTATSAAAFTVIPPPTITFFTPTSGPVGTEVSVHGSRFSTATAVTFNGTPVVGFTIVSDTLLRANVPASASSGPIRVTNPAGTATSAQSFTVTVPPVVLSFTPGGGPVGTQVTITGTGFIGTTAVTFNGAPATQLTVDSNTQIRATVPAGATTGKIRVTNGAGFGESATSFTVTVPPPQLTFSPTDDAYTSSQRKTTSYGTATDVQIRSTGQTLNAYFKFNVTGLGVPVVSAKLRLYCNNASNDGGRVYSVSNNYLGTTTPWVESGLTWNKAPIIGGTVLAQKGTVATGTWVEFDLTTAISGNGIYSFGISNGSSDVAGYNTKEATTNRPQLVIQVSSGSAMTAFPSGADAEAVGGKGLEARDQGNRNAGRVALGPSHPNPFHDGTQIRLELPRPGNVRLTVYDVMGRTVRTLVDGSVTSGIHELPWDGRDDAGNPVSSGVYLLRLETEGLALTRRLLRLR